MDVRRLQDVLYEEIHPRVDRFRGAFFCTFSLHPPRMRDLLLHCGLSPRDMNNVHVLFQRYSFNPWEGDPVPLDNMTRAEKLRSVLPRSVRFNRIRMKTSKHPADHLVIRQQHLKCCLLLFEPVNDATPNVVFIQFSMNIDRRPVDAHVEEMLYRGRPHDLPRFVDLIKSIVNLQGRIEVNEKKHTHANDLVPANQFLDRFRNDADRFKHLADPNAFLVWQSLDANDTLGHNFQRVLRNEGLLRDTQYRAYVGNQQPIPESILLLHFPYVNESHISNVCQAVVERLSHNPVEADRTHVELTYAALLDLHQFHHESWVVRLKDRTPDAHTLLWICLVTANLTMPSWSLRPRNYECGVVVFERPMPDGGPDPSILPVVRNRIMALMEPSNGTLKLTAKCGQNKRALTQLAEENEQLPHQQLMAPLNPDCEQERAACNQVYQALRAVDAAADNMTTFEKYELVKRCLVESVLPGLVGTAALIRSDALRYNFYFRYAVYDYIFNDLAKKHPPRTLGGYSELTTKRFFYDVVNAAPADHPWSTCPAAETTMQVLVDIFTRWSNAFDLYDRRINAWKPQVTERTLLCMTDARPGEQMVEDPHQKLRAVCTPYDTLSFLMQSMHSRCFVWWECPYNHTFYYNLNLMLTQDHECPVCAKYHDIRLMYELLQKEAGVTLLTVEFPLLRKSAAERLGDNAGDNPNNPPNADEDEGKEADQLDAEQVQMDKDRQTLKYDLFFLLDDKYVCAVEFDDASHNRASLRMENINVMRNPKADAVKNVLSSALGIHLMRVWVGMNELKRPDAKARLHKLVKFYLYTVRRNQLEAVVDEGPMYDRIRQFDVEQPDDNIAELTQLLQEMPQNQGQVINIENTEFLRPVDLLTRGLAEGDDAPGADEGEVLHEGVLPRYRSSETWDLVWADDADAADRLAKPVLPVSIVFRTDVPEQVLNKTLFAQMERQGMEGHKAMGLTASSLRVSTRRQLNRESCRNYSLFLQEWKRTRLGNAAEYAVAVEDPPSYRGRLWDGFDTSENGLAMYVSHTAANDDNQNQDQDPEDEDLDEDNQNQLVTAVHLEAKKYSPWRFVQMRFPGDVAASQQRAYSVNSQFVRLKDPFADRGNGDVAAGFPPLPPDLAPRAWRHVRTGMRSFTDVDGGGGCGGDGGDGDNDGGGDGERPDIDPRFNPDIEWMRQGRLIDYTIDEEDDDELYAGRFRGGEIVTIQEEGHPRAQLYIGVRIPGDDRILYVAEDNFNHVYEHGSVDNDACLSQQPYFQVNAPRRRTLPERLRGFFGVDNLPGRRQQQQPPVAYASRRPNLACGRAWGQ